MAIAAISGEDMKMKTQAAWMAVAALTMAAGMQGAVAQTSAGAGESGSATAQAGQASASVAQAASVSAELSKKLDAKDAKVGDEVVAKTTSEASFADGTKLPKGSKLVGHVTDVQAKSHDNHDSHLAFAFDHAVLKDGRELPIQVMTRAIAAPAQGAASTGSDDMMGAGGGGPRAGGGGGVGPANSAGGTVRGATGLAAGATSATAGSLNNATSGIDGTTNGALGSTGSSTANLGPNGTALNNAAGVNGALSGPDMPVGNLSAVTFNTVRATAGASPGGVTGSAGASTATMLTGHGKNVSLDSGSQMSLAVAPR